MKKKEYTRILFGDIIISMEINSMGCYQDDENDKLTGTELLVGLICLFVFGIWVYLGLKLFGVL